MLAKGKRPRTLREAADHIIALPPKETKLEHWQTAMACLLSAAEKDGPAMMARIGVVRALGVGESAAPTTPRKKAAKRYRIIR